MREQPAEQIEKWRLFVALPVPERVKDAIEQKQAKLKRATGEAAIRWAGREQFHITLRFLGAVAALDLEALKRSLEEVSGCSAFDITSRGIGFFPDSKKPRVVWCGVCEHPAGRLRRLFELVREATNPFTSEEPEHRFTGHITIGRIKGIRSRETAALRAAAAEEVDFGSWKVDGIELIRSQLSSSGARYEVVYRAVLAG